MFATEKIPIFPLGIVLMPNMAMPLHIFEDRYKEMINRCLEKHQVFGLVFHDGKKMASVGCTARILKVLKKYKDGKMDIIIQGQDRFEVENLFEKKSYLEAKVSYFDDVYEPDALRLEELATKLRKLFTKMFKIGGKILDIESLKNLDIKTLSFLAAFHEVLSPEEKQQFLEIRYIEERMQKGVEVIKKMIEILKMNKDIQNIIQSNGHLPVKFKK
ncbi:MAG: LON peptidase substrate-binding domain-containing protein [bacterium]